MFGFYYFLYNCIYILITILLIIYYYYNIINILIIVFWIIGASIIKHIYKLYYHWLQEMMLARLW